jgi:transcriptional regulator CtsR
MKPVLSSIVFALLFINMDLHGQLSIVLKLLIKQDEKIIYAFQKEGAQIKKVVKINESKGYNFITDEFAKNKNQLSYKKYIDIINEAEKNHTLTQAEASELKYMKDLEVLIMTADPKNISKKNAEEKLLEEQKVLHARMAKERAKIKAPTPLSLKNIDRAKVVVSIPGNELEFRNIFNSYHKKQCEDIVKLKSLLESEKKDNKNIDFLSSQAMLFELLSKDEKESPVIIIGHNENGLMHFPDKSKSKLQDIDSVAKKFSRIVVYLSCNANEYTENPAASYFLTYHEAVRLTNRLNSKIKMPFSHTQEECRIALQKKLDDYGKEKQLKFKLEVTASAISVSAIGYGIYEIRSKKNSIK